MALDQNALDSLRIDREADAQTPNPAYKWIIGAALTLALVAAAYTLLTDRALEITTAQATPATSSSGASANTAVLNASGYVVARRRATVSAKVTGKVAEVRIEEGMTVAEGDLLARLDDSSARPLHALAQRQLEAARNNMHEIEVRLAEATRTLARTEKLRNDTLVSEAQLDAARSEVAALTARLEALRSEAAVAASTVRVRAQELDDLLVRAPFDGVIVSKDAQPGEMVSPISAGGGFTRTGIATVVDMSSREIEVDVNESFINRVRSGQRTQAVLDAYPDWSIPSHVINIVPTADRQKATVRVRIGIDELDPRILPDMGIKVSFLEDAPTTNARPTVRIPASAITSEGAHTYVWRIRDGRAERVAVRVGPTRAGQVDVLAGLNAGDTVAATPVPGLTDGVAVKIVDR